MDKELGRKAALFVYLGIPILVLIFLAFNAIPIIHSWIQDKSFSIGEGREPSLQAPIEPSPQPTAKPTQRPLELPKVQPTANPTARPVNPYWLDLPELPADGGMLDMVHCGKPCFMGILPGETTADFNVIKKEYGLKCQSKTVTGTLQRCTTDAWQLDYEYDYYTKEIYYLRLVYKDMTLGEIMDVWGKPTRIYMDFGNEWDSAWPNILFFDDLLLGVWLHEPFDYSDQAEETGYRIAPDSKVDEIYVMVAGIYPFHSYDFNRDITILPWEGYGLYTFDGKLDDDI